MPRPIELKRGELYWVNWGDPIGVRPALIIQNDIGAKHSIDTIVAYITSAPKRDDLPMIVKFKKHKTSGDRNGAVDLGRILTIPKSMLGAKIGHLSSNLMPKINAAIKDSLGLD